MHGHSRQMPGEKPTHERKKELERSSKASHAAFGHLVGTERDEPMFPPELNKEKKWDEGVEMWRWRKGIKVDGKSVGGRYANPPSGEKINHGWRKESP